MTSPLERTLEQLSLLATIRGDAPERQLLARAAAFVRERGIASEGELGPLFDAPHDAADADPLRRLRQMYEAGGWVLVESALADIPADLRWLYESGAVTLDQLTALHCQLAITAVADLADALRRGQLLGVEGITEETAAAIAAAIPKLRASTPRIPLGRAVATVEPLLDALRGAPGIDWAEPAGSLRRGEDTVGDLELIAAAGDPSPAIDRLLNEASIIRCLHRSDRRLYLLLDRVQVGVLLPEPHAAGTLLLHRTGSARHLDLLRARAAARDVALDRPLASEEACYAALGLPYIAPELRNGDEEVARAGDNALPPLISQRDIRGDLHMHTVWSDGRDAVEEMVQASRALGYEYLAITDHSQNSAASRNLTIDGVKKQAEEIEQLRERYPDIAILHGCEVDILPDGRLDFPDRVLERFDIVLASLHDHAGQPPEQLMNRYESALSHPLVSVITHPTNRLVPHRRGYDLDYDRLFELAVHTGTALEIDGSPSHLDLDGALARRAIAAGATVSIDSDGHRADLLARQMHLGIVLARRGWVEPRHVLNTRPLADVRGFIAGKRAGR